MTDARSPRIAPVISPPITVSEWWVKIGNMASEVENKQNMEEMKQANLQDFEEFQKAKKIFSAMTNIGKDFDNQNSITISTTSKAALEAERKKFTQSDEQKAIKISEQLQILGPLTQALAIRYLILQEQFNEKEIKVEPRGWTNVDNNAKWALLTKVAFPNAIDRGNQLDKAIKAYVPPKPAESKTANVEVPKVTASSEPTSSTASSSSSSSVILSKTTDFSMISSSSGDVSSCMPEKKDLDDILDNALDSFDRGTSSVEEKKEEKKSNFEKNVTRLMQEIEKNKQQIEAAENQASGIKKEFEVARAKLKAENKEKLKVVQRTLEEKNKIENQLSMFHIIYGTRPSIVREDAGWYEVTFKNNETKHVDPDQYKQFCKHISKVHDDCVNALNDYTNSLNKSDNSYKHSWLASSQLKREEINVLREKLLNGNASETPDQAAGIIAFQEELNNRSKANILTEPRDKWAYYLFKRITIVPYLSNLLGITKTEGSQFVEKAKNIIKPKKGI